MSPAFQLCNAFHLDMPSLRLNDDRGLFNFMTLILAPSISE